MSETYTREQFLDSDFVSRETKSNVATKLDRYVELLKEANERFNLIGPSALTNLWQRHILDSAQLLPIVSRETKSIHSPVIMDIGSGGGFPAIILSILGVSNIHLVESVRKKADFLQAVVSELSLSATVHHSRAEDIKDMKADVITARAVANIQTLIEQTQSLRKDNTVCIFPKGQSVREELTDAVRNWQFEKHEIQSRSDPSGVIVVLKKVHHARQKSRRSDR